MRKTKQFLGRPPLDEFLAEWVPALPQGPYIQAEDAERWYHIMMARDPDRFAWHYGRLSGIGGSEIGEIAQRAMGYEATYNTVDHIVDLKRMRCPPDEANVFMRRGILAEDMISKIFHEDYAAVRQHDIIRAVGRHKLGWMSANLDDAVIINGATGVVDYKASSQVPDDTYLIYQAQLQLYDYLYADSLGLATLEMDDLGSRESPLAFDFMLNVFFDYEKGVTKPVMVPYDGELTRTMIEAGDAVWLHITQDQPLPEWPIKENPSQTLELNDEQKAWLDQQQLAVIQLRTAIDQLTGQLEGLNKEVIDTMKSWSGNDYLKGLESPFDALSLVARQTLDKEAWQSILTHLPDTLQEQVEQTVKYSSALDESKVLSLLASHNIEFDLGALCKRDYDVALVSELCLQHGITPPIKESVSVQMGRSKQAKAIIESIAQTVDVNHAWLSQQVADDDFEPHFDL